MKSIIISTLFFFLALNFHAQAQAKTTSKDPITVFPPKDLHVYVAVFVSSAMDSAGIHTGETEALVPLDSLRIGRDKNGVRWLSYNKSSQHVPIPTESPRFKHGNTDNDYYSILVQTPGHPYLALNVPTKDSGELFLWFMQIVQYF
jgi:hypothetical protein